MTVPYGIAVFEAEKKKGQTVRAADRFMKVSVSPQRNGQFAAESEPPGRFLNDPNEEVGSLEPIGSQRLRSGQVEKRSIHQIMD